MLFVVCSALNCCPNAQHKFGICVSHCCADRGVVEDGIRPGRLLRTCSQGPPEIASPEYSPQQPQGPWVVLSSGGGCNQKGRHFQGQAVQRATSERRLLSILWIVRFHDHVIQGAKGYVLKQAPQNGVYNNKVKQVISWNDPYNPSPMASYKGIFCRFIPNTLSLPTERQKRLPDM